MVKLPHNRYRDGLLLAACHAIVRFQERVALNKPASKIALALSCSMRLVYSVLAPTFLYFLPINWNLIRSNALTENIPAPNHGLRYLLLGIWERFDTLWYLHIARYGYDRSDSVVFYPLYPALVRIFSFVLDPTAGALLISTVAAFFLFWGLQRVMGDVPHAIVTRVLILSAVWPSSFIFFAGYPESLLLALIVWSLDLAKKESWLASAALALAAEMTKAVGAIVAVPLLVMASRRRSASTWPAFLTPFGALIFPGWVRWSGHGTIDSAYRQYWHTSPAPPWTTLFSAGARLLHGHSPILFLNAIFLIAFCIFVGVAKTRLEYQAYATAAIVVCLCKQTDPPLQSMMRYLIIVFPGFLGLAQLLQNSRWKSKFGLVVLALFVVNAAWMWLFLGWSLVL